MKKSNLILLIALGIIIIISITGIFVLKSNLFATITFGEGNIVQSERDIPSFEKIKINGRYNVYFTQDSPRELIIFTEENLHEFIRTDVRNNELYISSSQPIRSNSEIRIELSNDFLTHVEVSASGKFFTTRAIALPLLHLTANAGSTMDVEGIFESLFALQNAGATLKLRGETDKLNLESNAGGSLDASQMRATSATARANAGASIIVNAAELDAEANAGGSVRYLGDPVFKSMRTSAGGSINKQSR
ncbi:MAG: DUF2807 domain-containing protein [Bacteroidetes bacterium]|nr:MAG: DUF2807 domain-containing protein [Bacteroidota bacterium]